MAPYDRSMGVLTPSLVPADYVDADRYARECESVLAATWLPLCRVDQLAEPDTRVALDLIGRPVVAVRDGDAIRVLANVCAHRGSVLVEDGTSSGTTLVCPYHRWAYRLDGTLIGAPLNEGVEGPTDEWMPGVDDDHGRDLSVWGAFPMLVAGSMACYATSWRCSPPCTSRT